MSDFAVVAICMGFILLIVSKWFRLLCAIVLGSLIMLMVKLGTWPFQGILMWLIWIVDEPKYHIKFMKFVLPLTIVGILIKVIL